MMNDGRSWREIEKYINTVLLIAIKLKKVITG